LCKSNQGKISGHVLAAINLNDLPCDITRKLFRSQIAEGTDAFVGRSQSAHGNGQMQGLQLGWRDNDTGRQRINPNLATYQLLGQALGSRADKALGAGIKAGTRPPPLRAATLVRLMMLPPSSIWAIAYLVHVITDLTFRLKTSSNIWSLRLAMGTRWTIAPALLIRTSMRKKRRTVSATNRFSHDPLTVGAQLQITLNHQRLASRLFNRLDDCQCGNLRSVKLHRYLAPFSAKD
jgi:hypothetical protein